MGYDIGADEFRNKPPVIDITLNQASFTTGQTVIATVHITNDITPDKVDLKVGVQLPNGNLKSLENTPGYDIPANADIILPPITYTFSGSEAAGNYKAGGRLLEINFGGYLSTDIEPFSFNP